MAQFAGLADGTQARTLVRRLNELYDQEGSAFRVEEVAGGFQLMTRPCFSPWLRRLHAAPGGTANVEVRLSTPAMETLAVVAYRQPVLRAELEAIRGVQCGEMLRQLSERDLVRIVGRSQELGRPFLYATTKKFLQVFGLRSLDELPRAVVSRMSPAPILEPSASTSPKDSIESPEESAVKIAIFPHAESEEQLSLVAPDVAGDETFIVPQADAELEDEGEDDVEDEESEDDEEDDGEEEELEDEEFEDEDWEEVEDDDDEDWDEDDDDWDDEEDEDEDWDDEEED